MEIKFKKCSNLELIKEYIFEVQISEFKQEEDPNVCGIFSFFLFLFFVFCFCFCFFLFFEGVGGGHTANCVKLRIFRFLLVPLKEHARVPRPRSQISDTFFFHSKAWEAHDDILVEGLLLTCCNAGRGARYRTSFSPRFPHFEVSCNLNHVTKRTCIGYLEV